MTKHLAPALIAPNHPPSRRWSSPLPLLIAAHLIIGMPLAAADTNPIATPAAKPQHKRQDAASKNTITSLRIENTRGASHREVPISFGQVFVPGHLRKQDALAGRLADGSVVPLQLDVKASHADGSVRHAVVSSILPVLPPAGITLALVKAGQRDVSVTPGRANADPLARIELVLDGVTYTATPADASAAGKRMQWLSGPLVSETIHPAPFKTASGKVHPHLSARFHVRRYATSDSATRVDFTVENARTFAAGARNYTYDVKIVLGDRVVHTQTALTHFHHARWHRQAWTNYDGDAPAHVIPDAAYLIATRAVPNYDQSVKPSEALLVSYVGQLTPENLSPMGVGPIKPYMPTSGGRPDIGPLPGWAVSYLLSGDLRARKAMMAIADGAGSWPIHYRDEKTGFPIRLDNPVNRNISTHMNLNHRGPLPVPRCAGGEPSPCATGLTPDTAHQPSLAFLPYLLTGDYYYLEELQFWAAWNPTGTDPGNHGGTGLVRWQQLRGQAWSMRTLGHAAYITPDTHPMKAYFMKMVDANLDFYHRTYVVGNPNALGVYDGSGAHAFGVKAAIAPWQDDFFTWSLGYLAELGFAKARPIFAWKAKFPVGRMTAPGYCFIEGAAYHLKTRDAATGPVYASFAELYRKNFTGPIRSDAGKMLSHPRGLDYLDMPCGSQAQADWRSEADGRHAWKAGQMTGYASSEMGYPSNMQPALALAADAGIPNAWAAWKRFEQRAVKPDHGKGAQFNIVPRERDAQEP